MAMKKLFRPSRVFLQTLSLLVLFSSSMAWSQMTVGPLGSQNPAILVIPIVGVGVSASNVTYQGIGSSAATFSGGSPIVGFDSGIILSTGSATGVFGSAGVTSSTCNGLPGDTDMAALAGTAVTNVYDATVLSFDFIPTFSTVSFNYVFASEEYNAFIGSTYNDVFGFFVNGVNVALVPGTSSNVSINTVNDCTNPAYFIDNIGSPQGGACTIVKPAAGLATAMNGLTTVLTASASVNPGVINHIKMAIADVGDCRNDSNVFIQANSFTSAFTPTFTPIYSLTPCNWPGLTCTPTFTGTPTPSNTPLFTDTPCGFPGNTCTFTPTRTFTPTWTPTATATYTTTSDLRPTNSLTSTYSPTFTLTKTLTPTPTITPTPTLSFTQTYSPTPCGYPGNTCTFTPTPVNEDIFYVDKNLFKPVNGQAVSIYIGNSTSGEYALRVYNSAGELVRVLGDQYLTSLVSQSYSWDGKNSSGTPCASGVYVLYLVEPFGEKMRRVLLVR